MGTPVLTREIDKLVNAALPADDCELLRRYRDAGDSEAFESIVRRHARTVLGVCQRILIDPHAAEDAFQATFLQFVRKARSLRSPVALAAWLYATARRTALRHRRPVQAPMTEPHAPGQSPLDLLTARELLQVIEDEIARLPEPYRLPLILCYLDGLTKGEAAERLGLAAGVFRGRLDRGREKLRSALVRRGFAPIAVIGLLVPTAGSVSAELMSRTIGICTCGEPIPAAIALLAAGRTGVLMKAGLVAGLLLLGGLGLIASTDRAEPAAPQTKLEPSRPATSEPRRDLYGDSLPPDAIARMGTIRWRHVGSSGRVVPSPSGKLVVTRTIAEKGKGTARVWELSDGRQVCEFPWENSDSGGDLRFTPDGSRLALTMSYGVVKFLDPLTGKLLAESKPILGKNVRYRLTSDTRWVVTQEEKGPLMLTEIVTDPTAKSRRVKLDPPPGTFRFHSGGFHCDGKTLMSCTHDETSEWQPLIVRWDIRTGKLSGKTPLRGCKDVVIAFSQDGKRVATERPHGPPPDLLRVWDTETGEEIVKEESARHGVGIPLSPDGKRLVGRMDRPDNTTAVIVWELDRGKSIARLTLPEWAYGLFLLPDGKTLLAASFTGMMFGTWDIATGRRLSPNAGHESNVQHVAFTPDGKTLLTASYNPDERVTVWDAATGKKLQELAAPHGRPLFLVGPSAPFVLTPGGSVVTTGQGTLIWTDVKTGRELRRVMPKPIAMAMDPNDCFQQEWVLLTHDPQTGRPAVLALHSFGPSPFLSEPKYKWKEAITLLDAESGELLAFRIYSRNRYHSDGVIASPDGRLLARVSYDLATDVSVELRSAFGRGSFTLPHPGDHSPRSLFAPDSQTLITVTRKRSSEKPAGAPEPSTIRLWEVRSGKKRLEFSLPVEPSALAISPNGRFLAAERPDNNTISIWDLATGTELAKRSGYGAGVGTLAFRPDGQALASGHADGTALVWDLSGLSGVKSAATDRDAAWKALASADAGKAYQAVIALAADPNCVAFLRDKVKPVAAVPTSQLQKLVKDLGDDEFKTREAATAALKKLGDVADVELRAFLRGELPPEQHRRILEVLAKRPLIESDPDRLRKLRCVEVLERVGSVEARSVLGELAKGAAGARLTREAAGALLRLTTLAKPGK
ncbi:MAG: sigma-70 family RNA polymerase sigma factor [Planctomycetia bacterium]|nr:sigma-70 family RNA polymerase sigma factor [Planctomycetia bacterium]